MSLSSLLFSLVVLFPFSNLLFPSRKPPDPLSFSSLSPLQEALRRALGAGEPEKKASWGVLLREKEKEIEFFFFLVQTLLHSSLGGALEREREREREKFDSLVKQKLKLKLGGDPFELLPCLRRSAKNARVSLPSERIGGRSRSREWKDEFVFFVFFFFRKKTEKVVGRCFALRDSRPQRRFSQGALFTLASASLSLFSASLVLPSIDFPLLCDCLFFLTESCGARFFLLSWSGDEEEEEEVFLSLSSLSVSHSPPLPLSPNSIMLLSWV